MTGYVALGSNLGHRLAWLQAGLDALARRGLVVTAVSSVWETEPVDADGSPWFLNAVARIETTDGPEAVLDHLLAVERALGRVRSAPNAPRTLDLDLLVLGDRTARGPRLTLPHPRMWVRRFVLAPLVEVGPDVKRSETGRTAAEELAALSSTERVRRIGRLAMPQAPPVYSGLS